MSLIEQSWNATTYHVAAVVAGAFVGGQGAPEALLHGFLLVEVGLGPTYRMKGMVAIPLNPYVCLRPDCSGSEGVFFGTRRWLIFCRVPGRRSHHRYLSPGPLLESFVTCSSTHAGFPRLLSNAAT